jgi:hypothetical protein
MIKVNAGQIQAAAAIIVHQLDKTLKSLPDEVRDQAAAAQLAALIFLAEAGIQEMMDPAEAERFRSWVLGLVQKANPGDSVRPTQAAALA